MIIDSRTNLLYLADCLPQKFPNFFKDFERILNELSINYKFLPGTKDVWAVDYMPVQVAIDKFIQFIYDPKYLHDKDPVIDKIWQKTISDTAAICKSIGIKTIKSQIKVDGGNVMRSPNKVLVTNKIFSENPDINEKQLIKELKVLFDVDALIILPKDPTDFTGHADGMVRFIDDNRVFINKYGVQDKKLERAIKDCLLNANLDWVEILYNPYDNKTNMDAKGVYINYLQMEDVVIMPVFGIPEDDIALQQLENVFGANAVKTIESSELAKQGGVLNCISWNIYA
jgi:agmatine deiminase